MNLIYRPPQRNQKQWWLRSLGISLLTSILAAAGAAAQEGKIEFQVLAVPPNLNISDSHSNAVIRSEREWNTWVINLREVPTSLPSVDFEKYTLLIANAGYKSNGPYEVKFDSVTDLPNEVRVHISVTGPASCPAEPEAGHYVAMAVFPRTDKPVQFDVTTRNSSCPHR
ncbi:MAG: hypothetical protein ACLPV8_19310 [Steroidobacteraceae bacterium]